MNYFIVHDYDDLFVFQSKLPSDNSRMENDRQIKKNMKIRNETTRIKNMKNNLPCFVGMFRGVEKKTKENRKSCLFVFSVVVRAAKVNRAEHNKHWVNRGKKIWISERLNSHYIRFKWTKMKIKSLSCSAFPLHSYSLSLIDKTDELKKKNVSDFCRELNERKFRILNFWKKKMKNTRRFFSNFFFFHFSVCSPSNWRWIVSEEQRKIPANV